MIDSSKTLIGWNNIGICLPCDIVHVKTPGHWMSFATREFEQVRDENPSWASHTGMISSHGTVIEALWRVTERVIRPAYENASHVVVTRVPNLTDIEKAKIVFGIREHIGQKYGWWNILKHAVGLKKTIGNPNRPICSYLIAHEFWQQAMYEFGVRANEAQPDDIMDFCIYNNHPVVWCSSKEALDDILHVYGNAEYAAELIRHYAS